MFSESVILVVGEESGGSDGSESVASLLTDGFRIIGAEHPDDALTYASDSVDLIITHLDSPNFSGLSLLRLWKAQHKHTPFMVITAGDDVGAVVEAMKLGAADCIVKPIDADELQMKVSTLVERSRSITVQPESNGDRPNDRRPNIDIPVGTSLEDLERAAVEQALAQHHGNRTHAAKTLGISVRTLQRKLKAWGLPVISSFHSSHSPSASFLYSAQHPHHLSTPFSSHAL